MKTFLFCVEDYVAAAILNRTCGWYTNVTGKRKERINWFECMTVRSSSFFKCKNLLISWLFGYVELFKVHIMSSCMK